MTSLFTLLLGVIRCPEKRRSRVSGGRSSWLIGDSDNDSIRVYVLGHVVVRNTYEHQSCFLKGIRPKGDAALRAEGRKNLLGGQALPQVTITLTAPVSISILDTDWQ
jgi:hypothetical protein